MNFPILRAIPVLRAVGFSVLLAAVCGCATSPFTYSQDAKREGRKEFNDGRYVEAAASFKNAAQQNPTDADADYWMGMSYEGARDFHQAIDAYKTALAQMPQPTSPYYNRDLRLTVFDRLAHVVATADNANGEIDLILKEAMAEKSSEKYRLAGRIFRYRGDADSALDQYHQAITLDHENFAAQKELGLYLEQLSQNQEAAIALRDAYRLTPGDDEVNAALRRIGMVPGPSLLAQDKLIKPFFNEPGAATPAAQTSAPTPIVPQQRN
jgi:tetratricopeptide (TPR) repeat protein